MVVCDQGPVVQSVISLTSSLRVISLTVLEYSMYNILIFFAEKMRVAFAHFFSKKFQHICVSLDVNFNESFNDSVSFEQLGPDCTFKTLSDCRSRGHKSESQLSHTAPVEIDQAIISMVILPLLLIQERQFSVTGESECTSTDNDLED